MRLSDAQSLYGENELSCTRAPRGKKYDEHIGLGQKMFGYIGAGGGVSFISVAVG